MTSTLKDRLSSLLAGMPRGSQAALARACGIRGPSVSAWLSGHTKTLEGENLLNAARFFNVSPEWLATGRGQRERLRAGEDPANYLLGGLDETVTLDPTATQSQPVKLDPHILVEAEKWVLFEEGPLVRQPDGSMKAKHAYALFPRAERLSALYAMIAADGGTLSPANAQKLIQAASARLEQGEERDRTEDRGTGRTASVGR